MLMGKVIEHADTETMFVTPRKRETADYIVVISDGEGDSYYCGRCSKKFDKMQKFFEHKAFCHKQVRHRFNIKIETNWLLFS